MARKAAAKPPVTPPAEDPQETEGAVTAPETTEEAPAEITIAFPLPVEPHVGDGEERPLLVRVDH